MILQTIEQTTNKEIETFFVRLSVYLAQSDLAQLNISINKQQWTLLTRVNFDDCGSRITS